MSHSGDTSQRSLVKALAWRVFAACNTLFAAVVLTKGRAGVASKIAGSDSIIKTILFYFYERAWSAVAWGKVHVCLEWLISSPFKPFNWYRHICSTSITSATTLDPCRSTLWLSRLRPRHPSCPEYWTRQALKKFRKVSVSVWLTPWKRSNSNWYILYMCCSYIWLKLCKC